MRQDRSSLGLQQGQVRLAPWTPDWACLFDEEAARLLTALSDLDPMIEHCGSTSVAGLAAKPILDLLVGIARPIDVAAIERALGPLGYEHASWAGVPGHEVFGKSQPRTHLLHVVPLGGEAWDRMLAFRDALRGSPKVAAQYAALKQDLASRFADQRSVYTEGKSAFIAEVLASGR